MLKTTTLILLAPFFVSIFWLIALLLPANRNAQNRKRLALTMLWCAIVLLTGIALIGKYYTLHKTMHVPFYFSILSAFPSFYIYIHSLTDEKGFSTKSLLHYIFPAIVALVSAYIFFIWLTPEEAHDFISKVLVGIDVNNTKLRLALSADRFMNISSVVSAIVYYFYTNRRVRKHRKRIEEYFSNTDNLSLGWIKFFNGAFFISLASVVFMQSVGRELFITYEWALIFPLTSFLIFIWIIGYFGNIQTNIYPQNGNSKSQTKLVNYDLTELNIRLKEISKTEKIYLNPDLTLPGLAQKLGTNRSYLSKVINKEHHLNFNQFVNKHRVEEAAGMLQSENFRDLTVKDIGDKCGFSNHNSFIRWFKEYFGLTPGSYRKQKTEKQSL
jgi:AraC-like DNA-binding protein